MYCPKCGAENIDGEQICQSCSGTLEWSDDSEKHVEPAEYSQLAITSLVLAIVSPFTAFISAVQALIIGMVSLVKIKKVKGN